MEILKAQLDDLIDRLGNADDFRLQLDDLVSVLPFNRYEFVIATLLSRQKLAYEEYVEMRNAYIDRNLYLSIFEISSPRGFGDTWAFGHLLEVESDLKRPSKKIDPAYSGQYDLYLEHKEQFIRIEVKASRAVDRQRPELPLFEKALSSDSKMSFLMNFQQMKPSCCDVFIWLAVYRDKIKYWAIPSDHIQTHRDFVPQHRNEGTASRGSDFQKTDIFEGQLMITDQNINKFDEFLCSSKDLKNKIIVAFKQQSKRK